MLCRVSPQEAGTPLLAQFLLENSSEVLTWWDMASPEFVPLSVQLLVGGRSSPLPRAYYIRVQTPRQPESSPCAGSTGAPKDDNRGSEKAQWREAGGKGLPGKRCPAVLDDLCGRAYLWAPTGDLPVHLLHLLPTFFPT